MTRLRLLIALPLMLAAYGLYRAAETLGGIEIMFRAKPRYGRREVVLF